MSRQERRETARVIGATSRVVVVVVDGAGDVVRLRLPGTELLVWGAAARG